MKRNRAFFLLVQILLATAGMNLQSCRHEIILPDNIPEICFEREVLPIFRNSCGITGCHDGSGEADYTLTNYLGISHAVVSGKPYESPAYEAIIERTGEERMPPDRPLDREKRTIIRLWIDNKVVDRPGGKAYFMSRHNITAS